MIIISSYGAHTATQHRSVCANYAATANNAATHAKKAQLRTTVTDPQKMIATAIWIIQQNQLMLHTALSQ